MNNIDKKIEVPESIFEQMQKELKELQTKVKKQEVLMGNDEIKSEGKEPVTVGLREYNDQLVVGLDEKRGTWFEYDKEKREENLMQEIILIDEKGNEKRKVVKCSEFYDNSKIVEVPVKKIRKKKVVDEKGLIRVREVVDYKTVMKKDKVMQKVTSSEDYVTVILPNKEEKEININFVNL